MAEVSLSMNRAYHSAFMDPLLLFNDPREPPANNNDFKRPLHDYFNRLHWKFVIICQA